MYYRGFAIEDLLMQILRVPNKYPTRFARGIKCKEEKMKEKKRKDEREKEEKRKPKSRTLL